MPVSLSLQQKTGGFDSLAAGKVVNPKLSVVLPVSGALPAIAPLALRGTKPNKACQSFVVTGQSMYSTWTILHPTSSSLENWDMTP